MSKKTDYKKLYKKVKKENTSLFNKNVGLTGLVNSQAQMIKDIRDGKIKIKKEKK